MDSTIFALEMILIGDLMIPKVINYIPPIVGPTNHDHDDISAWLICNDYELIAVAFVNG